jgi:FkbM family methyltransferase
LGVFHVLREIEVFAACLLRRIHDDDFILLPRNLGPGPIVDVGANLGQSIVSLRAIYPGIPIVSFEPNPACMRSLRRIGRFMGAVEVRNLGVGRQDSVMEFHTPMLADGTELLQEGSFDPTVFDSCLTRERIGASFSLRSQLVPVCALDSTGLEPSLLKIDVQGLELQVLQGAKRIIAEHRPHIFLEMESGSMTAIEEYLSSFGYRAQRLQVNCLFVPG